MAAAATSLARPNRIRPTATMRRWWSRAGRWRLIRATRWSLGSSRSSSADSRAKVAWGVEAGDGQQDTHRDLAQPQDDLVGHDGHPQGPAEPGPVVLRSCLAHRRGPQAGLAGWRARR